MTPGDGDPGVALHVVHLEGGGDHEGPMAELGGLALSPGLFLVRSELSQSRLYHLVKRTTGAPSLFVGRLAGTPKFTGMAPGALATLRAWGEDDGA